MNKWIMIPILMLFAIVVTAQIGQKIPDNQNNENMEGNTIKLTIEGGKTFTATLVDNSSSRVLIERLNEGDLTIEMEDYANMEKVGSLGMTLPRNDRQTTTSAGDLILYQGRNLVIYYDSNAWNFTRLGKINDVTQKELKAALGASDVTVTLSIK